MNQFLSINDVIQNVKFYLISYVLQQHGIWQIIVYSRNRDNLSE